VVVAGQKKRVVSLAVAHSKALEKITNPGVHPARMIMRARVLLELDTNAGEVS
jgi:hypothetical protein